MVTILKCFYDLVEVIKRKIFAPKNAMVKKSTTIASKSPLQNEMHDILGQAFGDIKKRKAVKDAKSFDTIFDRIIMSIISL